MIFSNYIAFFRYLLISVLIFGLQACLAPIELFEVESTEADVDHIGNFYATRIFEDQISKELWYSPDGGCMQVTTTNEGVYSGSGALHITWDKGKGGCDWLGMGIGWANWSGKNFGQIYDRAAITFKVRTDGRSLKTLPLAIGLEDYGNLQAWTGFSRKMMDSPEINGEWSTVTIPLLAFNWNQANADVSNIKQIIIQFEASGDFYIDEVRVVEHQGSLRSRVEVPRVSDELNRAGVFELLKNNDKGITIEENSVKLAINSRNLFVQAEIVDSSPLQNEKTGDKVWDGDAIEIAFSSNANSSPLRSYFLTSDHQIGLRASEEGSYVWDWRHKKPLSDAEVKTHRTKEGYLLEAVVPLASLGISAYEISVVYGLEVAIDQGTLQGRTTQLRWNTPDVNGFYENPSLWGEMKIVAPE